MLYETVTLNSILGQCAKLYLIRVYFRQKEKDNCLSFYILNMSKNYDFGEALYHEQLLSSLAMQKHASTREAKGDFHWSELAEQAD